LPELSYKTRRKMTSKVNNFTFKYDKPISASIRFPEYFLQPEKHQSRHMARVKSVTKHLLFSQNWRGTDPLLLGLMGKLVIGRDFLRITLLLELLHGCKNLLKVSSCAKALLDRVACQGVRAVHEGALSTSETP
jgi:hypothetical protein